MVNCKYESWLGNRKKPHPFQIELKTHKILNLTILEKKNITQIRNFYTMKKMFRTIVVSVS